MTAPTAGEIKFRLEAKLQELGSTIVDVHSTLLEDGMVHVGFDVVDASGEWVLFFVFAQPALVSRDDLAEFSRWLAGTGRCPRETLH